jgi:predicted nucleic acid-binding protein
VIVYVESNFILEIAFIREDYGSCMQIIDLAKSSQVDLVLPAYSVGEPYEALVRRSKRRRDLHAQLIQEIKELSRSKPYSGFMSDAQEITDLLIRSVEEERKRLEVTLNDMLTLAEIIPIESTVIKSAITFQSLLNLSPQDAIVYASVVTHLERSTQAPKCFLTRNAKDFVNPDIIEQLATYDCRLFSKFADGLGYIQNQTTQATN